jgi:cobalt/nickel transport system permease protein
MSSSIVSGHIPDLNLITYYAEKQNSVFSRISPWTKLSVLVLVILFITLSDNLWILAGLYSAVLSLYILARLPVGRLFAWYLIPLLFVLSLVGIMAWVQPGNAVISIDLVGIPLTLTDQGIILVATLVLKALISVTYSFFFLMTTRYEYFSGMIYQVFPAPLDQIFLMTYRFLFLTLAMIGSMIKAVRSRGGGLIHSIRMQSRMFAEVFAILFIRSFERAERVRKAMDARGYNGTYTTNVQIPTPGMLEYTFLVVFILVMVAASRVAPFKGW